MLAPLTQKLRGRADLTAAEAAAAAGVLASPEGGSDDDKAAFLEALADKGETSVEIAAFATAYRASARDPGVQAWAPRALDVVGTGGDHAGGFNISSLVVLVLASAGVTVMKHGNRGVTSKCGSADLLAALGLDLEASPEKCQRALDELGFCFFFAPAYHPAFRYVAPARKLLAARGRRTVFNLLGPLINPGQPAHALVGAFSSDAVRKIAGALDELGCAAGLVAHGVIGPERGIDEMTTATPNFVRGAGRLRAIAADWTPSELGFAPSDFADLLGGDVAHNVGLVEAILAGRGPKGLVDTIVLNAAAGMWVVGATNDIRAGVDRARDLLLGGAVAGKISDMKRFYRS
ncbi:MAG TPA: anthranilate phosphoribosyltransferase [Candidatus Didemnitutus sp.]|nr:anthranilate phosphoribosyltransferase [Candidatus Didemnitutus sp.]